MKFQNWSKIKEFSSVCTFSKKLTYAEKVGWWPAERFLLIWSQLITLWRTCLQVELNIFHEREARAVDFYVFCGKSERESETEMRGEGLWESLITINRGEREGEGEEQPRSRAPSWIFCKDDGDCNENVKKWHVHQQNNNFACAAFSFPISCSCTTTTRTLWDILTQALSVLSRGIDKVTKRNDGLLGWAECGWLVWVNSL